MKCDARVGIAGLALSLVANACSPCFGVVGCADAPHTSIDGRVMSDETGVGVPDVVVTMDEPSAMGNTASATTDSRGLFSVRLPTPASHRISLRIVAPGMPGYSIDSVACPTLEVRTDGCLLAPVVPAAWLPYLARVVKRGPDGELLPLADVEFTRTGGTEWFGPDLTPIVTSKSDASGVVAPFPPRIYTTSIEALVGDFRVRRADGSAVYEHRNIALPPVYLVADRPFFILSVGPSLDYVLAFTDSASGQPVPDVLVRFTRNGGIPATPAQLESRSDANGLASLALQALDEGALIGDLTIQPKNFAATVISGFTLHTFDADTSRVAARWRIGPTGVLHEVPGGAP